MSVNSKKEYLAQLYAAQKKRNDDFAGRVARIRERQANALGTPAEKPAGGTSGGDFSSVQNDVLAAVDNARGQQSGQAALAALQGVSAYGKMLGNKPAGGAPATDARAVYQAKGVHPDVVQTAAEQSARNRAILPQSAAAKSEAMRAGLSSRLAAPVVGEGAKAPQADVVLPGVTRPYTEEEQLSADIDKLKAEKQQYVAKRIGSRNTYEAEIGELQKQIDEKQSALAALQGKSPKAGDTVTDNRYTRSREASEEKLANRGSYVLERGLEGVRSAVENIGTTLKSAGKSAIATAGSGAGTKPVAKSYKDAMETGLETSGSAIGAARNRAMDEMIANVAAYSKSGDQKKRMETLEEKYSDADINTVTRVLGDIAQSAGYSLPADVAGLIVGPAGTAVVMGTAAFSDALSDAIEKGYSREDAIFYATQETLNQAAMETLFDIAGGGLAEGKIMDTLDQIPSALGKTAAKIGVTGVGEGAEEVAQSIITTLNQRAAGDEEASVDLSELGYEFLVGSLSGALRGAPVQAVQAAREAGANTPTAAEKTPTASVNTPTEVVNTPTETAETEQNVSISEEESEEVAEISEDVAISEDDVIKTDTADEDSVEGFEEETESYADTDEESPLERALRTAETDLYTAGNEYLAAYEGNVRAAVDALYAEGNRLVKDGSPEARTRLETVEKLRDNIVTDSAVRVINNKKHLEKELRDYGVKNVLVDMKLAGSGSRGYYEPVTKSIMLSPTLSGRDAVNFVASHELFHHAAAADTTLVNDVYSLRDSLSEKGLIDGSRFTSERYMAAYADVAYDHAKSAVGQAELKANMDKGMSREEAIRKITDDYIRQEMAADILGELVQNPEVMKKLSREDRTLWQRIVDALRNFVAKVTGKGETLAQQRLLDTIRGILEETSGESVSRTVIKNGVAYNEAGEAVSYQTKNGSVRLSIATYEDGGRDTLAQYMDAKVASGELSASDRDDILSSMDEIYGLCKNMTGEYKPFGEWSEAVVEVDENGDPVFSVVKPNGEYAMNLDFSLVCKKRRALDAVFNEMIRRGVISDFDLGQDKIVQINDIIREHGFETACTFCFVDSKRFRQAKVADDFVKMYNGLVRSMANGGEIGYFNFGGDETLPAVEGGIDTMADDALDFTKLDKVLAGGKSKTVPYKIAQHLKDHPEDRKLLSRGDFMSSGGFEAVKKQNPAVLSLYNSKKGSGGPKASFGDVQYLSDVIKDSKFKASAAYDVGGVRVQSFSDYVARLVFDYVQMIGDLAAKGLPAHAYTKEILFVKQFGLTGMKINMSLAPAVGDGRYAGLNADGSYAFAAESFDFETAKAIQNDPEYGKNCGTIAIGVSDEHIWKLLSDPDIRMVIPYHKSGLNPVVAKMNNISQFSDYTKTQNTRYKDGKKLSEADMKNHPNFNRMKQDGMNAVEAARAYVQWCGDNGYLPKFDKFAYNADGTFNENYYKLLEDFTTMVDGRYHPQGPVKAVFPTGDSAFGSMESLIREGLDADAVTQARQDNEVVDIVDEIEEMLGGESGGNVRHSRDVEDADRITVSSSDSERAEILSGKTIIAPAYSGQAEASISENKEDLESAKIGLVKAALDRIGEEFGVFGNYDIDDIDVEVSFSKSNLKESVSKKADAVQLARLMPVFRDAVESSVGIEAHGNRYYYDNKTVLFENLLGGYVDGDAFVPVRFGLKHIDTGETVLYVVVSQEKIDNKKITAKIVKTVRPQTAEAQISPSAVTYSIADIVPFVNTKDLLRYLPDDMLTGEQKKIKWEGIAETIQRTNNKNDEKYAEFVRSGNMRAAGDMVKAAAKANGYTTEAYHGTNGGDFTVFDWDKTQSTDGGFFGRGHYFTKYERIAKEYGDRVVKANLRLGKTFIWSEEVNSYDGKRPPEILSRNVVSRINLAKHFPDIFEKNAMYYYDYDDNSGEYVEKKIKWGELESVINAIGDKLTLRSYADGSYRWHTEGKFWEVPVGEVYSTEQEAEDGKFFAAINALGEKYNGLLNGMSFDDQTTYTQTRGSEVTEILRKNGYDSAMDTPEGGEIVVFDSSQIKSADPVTYDDNGNVIPLSERFKDDNADIRFSRDVYTEEEKLEFKLQQQRKFIQRQYTAETAFGSAVAASPAQRKAFATEVAHGLPGVTVETVERAISPVWDVFEEAKRGQDDTVQSRVEEAYKLAKSAAQGLIDGVTAKRVNPLYEQYADLRKILRTTPIKNTISVKEFGGAEDYAKWRNGNRGLLRISGSADAIGVDVLYSELCDTYPEFFSADVINPADMLKRLGEVAVELKKTASTGKADYDPLEGYRERAVEELADRIMIGFNERAVMTLEAKRKQEGDKAKARAKESEEAYRMQEAEHKRQVSSIVRGYNTSLNRLVKEVDRQSQKIDRMTQTLSGRSSNLLHAAEKKRFLANLNRLYTMLTEPNKKKHIPEGMKRDVAELLSQFGGTVLTDTKFVDAKLLQSIVNSVPDMQIENGDIRVEDPFIASLKADLRVLDGIRETITAEQQNPNTKTETLVRMGTDYMRSANNVLKKLSGYIATQNQLFIDGKIMEADAFAADLISDLSGRRRYREWSSDSTFGGEYTSAKRAIADKMHYEAMSAGLFFEMIGESGVQLDRTFRAGQNKQAAHEEEFVNYMRRRTKGKYSTFKAGGHGGNRINIDVGDGSVDVSKAQLMSLYLLWKRPAARRHLEAQGAVFTDTNGKEHENRTGIITQDVMDRLMKHLSAEDLMVADAMQSFLARQCSDWGNEAAMQMYGFRMYEDPDYFPIRVSETVKMRSAPAWGAQLGDISLENSGFTKRVDKSSRSAIVIGNVFDVAESHVKRMASYNAYAPICNDLQRVLSRSEVRGAIKRGLGDEGLRYIDNFLKNVNDNKVTQREGSGMYAWMSFLGNMSKRAAVAFNLSTVAKQPLSIVRVFNEMDPQYIAKAIATKGFDARFYQTAEYKRLYDTMVENSGVAKMKMLGYSDAGFAKSMRQQWDDSYVNTDGALRSVMTAGKATRALTQAYDWLSDLGMKGAAWADERTWVTIWKACELESADKYAHLSESERLDKTTERFGEIVGRTQVVDSVLDTAPYKDNLLGSGLGAFMNEPVKQYAELVVAVDALKNTRKGTGKRAKAAKKFSVVLTTALASNLILEPIVSAIFSGLRDEEDDSEQAMRKFIRNYLGIDLTDDSEGVKATDIAASQFVDGIVGFVPAVGEIYGLVVDALAGYDNTRFETDGLQSVVKSVAALFTGGGSKTGVKKVSELLSALGLVTGIPYKTLSRDIRAICRDVMYATDNHLAAWNMNKVYYNLGDSSARSGKYFYDILAHAYKEGDTEAYAAMRKELAEIPMSSSYGVSQDTITSNIEKRGGKVEVGSQLWYIDLQAAFSLESFNKDMKAEAMITDVYRKTGAASVLPKSPSPSFTVSGETVKIEDPVQYQAFAEEVGEFSYMILVNMAADKDYGGLTDEQKCKAIEKAYDYARKRGRKNLYGDYNMANNLYGELYSQNATPSAVSKKILADVRAKK